MWANGRMSVHASVPAGTAAEKALEAAGYTAQAGLPALPAEEAVPTSGEAGMESGGGDGAFAAAVAARLAALA